MTHALALAVVFAVGCVIGFIVGAATWAAAQTNAARLQAEALERKRPPGWVSAVGEP
jgi:uncharacterized membrane protein YciS (DUF1049 family)